MMIVLVQAAPNTPPQVMIEGGSPEQVLQVLGIAYHGIQQQMQAPKLLLPNGQVKAVLPTSDASGQQQ